MADLEAQTLTPSSELADRGAQATPNGTYPQMQPVEAPDVFDSETTHTAVDLVNAGI